MSNFNLRQMRKSAGLTQAQLADKLKINRATVSKYETGEIVPSIEQVVNICAVLDVSFEELFGEKPGMKPSEVYQSIKLDDYVKSLGYEFHDSYPDAGSDTWLCVDNNEKKLYLLSKDDVEACEKFIQAYAKFQIADIIKKGKEIQDTDGWFTHNAK